MNISQVLDACENDLGWVPEGDRLTVRKAQFTILKHAMTKHGFTVDDLALAVAWAARRRLPIQKPIQLIGFVDEARAVAAEPVVVHPIEDQISEAIVWEDEHPDADSRRWVSRLIRAMGPARWDVLVEWRQAGRGPKDS